MLSETLSRKENVLMRAVFELSGGQERFLLSPYELLSSLPQKYAFTEEKIERTLYSLELDGYFDFVLSERKGEKTYVVHMKERGLAFRREDDHRRRSVWFRWGVAAVGAVITFLIGWILKAIFH